MTTTGRPPVRTFKPRRRSLSPARQALVDRLATRWMLAEEGDALDLPVVFGRVAPVVLEVGFGGGEATLELARARPDVDIVAVDVHTPGISQVVVAVDAEQLTNVRLVHGDALVFLHRLPASSLDGVRIWFPDPWPKVRHRHRRIVRPDVVDQLVDLLQPGGWLHLATDVADYAEQMAEVCSAHPRLAGGVIERPAWRPRTRFEERGGAAGRRAVDLWFERQPSPAVDDERGVHRAEGVTTP